MTATDIPLDAEEVEYERLFRAERTMVIARWIAALFAFAQVVTFYKPYPSHVLSVALVIVGLLFAGNIVFSYLLRRRPLARQLRAISIATLSFDLFIAEGLVWTYTFDSETAIWAVLYILPLGGAIRFQRRGAIWVTVGASAGYLLRDIFGYFAYDNEFLISSITFRCGIAFLIAFVAGSTTKELLDGRREVERANRELLDVNSSMREFVSIASHDMRTPVSIITGLSDTMSRNADSMSADQKNELIKVISRRAQSLERLVNDLLATSSIDAGILPCRPEAIDTSDLLRDIQQTSNIDELTLRIESNSQTYADPEHLRRILNNLLANANRYGAAPIVLRFDSYSPWVEFTMEDSGTGVPVSFVPRLFDKFARAPETARQTEGTGLGLSIVKGLVLQNGGSVTYKQGDNGGASFSVTLPEYNESENKEGAAGK